MPSISPLSQLADVTDEKWKLHSCGIASWKMVADLYLPEPSPSLDELIKEANEDGDYIPGKGWLQAGLASLAQKYGLSGVSLDFTHEDKQTTWDVLLYYLKKTPVIISVNQNFSPSADNHLIVLEKIEEALFHIGSDG